MARLAAVAGVAASLLLAGAARAGDANTLAGYVVASPATHQATATFKVPQATCTGTASTILIGASIWRSGGGNTIGAAVQVQCPGTSGATPAYRAEGYFHSKAAGTVVVPFPALAVSAGTVVVVTVVAGAAVSKATIVDVSTGRAKQATFAPAAGGSSFVGISCTMDWNIAAPCPAMPQLTDTPFSAVRVDTKAITTYPAGGGTEMGGSGWVVGPDLPGPTKSSFNLSYTALSS